MANISKIVTATLITIVVTLFVSSCSCDIEHPEPRQDVVGSDIWTLSSDNKTIEISSADFKTVAGPSNKLRFNINSTVKAVYVGDIKKSEKWGYPKAGEAILKSDSKQFILGDYVCLEDQYIDSHPGELRNQRNYTGCAMWEKQEKTITIFNDTDESGIFKLYPQGRKINVSTRHLFDYGDFVKVMWELDDLDPAIQDLLTGLTAYYGFDSDGSDDVGGNTCTLQNGAYINTSGKLVNQSITFNGNNDNCAIGDDSDFDFGTGDFSISFCMFAFGSGGTEDYIIHQKISSGNYNQWGFREDSGGTLTFFTYDNGYTRVIINDIPTNEWTHVVGTRDGTTMTVYMNGVFNESASGTVRDISPTTGSIYLGTDNTGTGKEWQGSLDELGFWKGVELNASQVSSLYNESNCLGFPFEIPAPIDDPRAAATYYISPGGDDSNDGNTTGAPFRTVDRLNDETLYPNDTVRFERGGTWLLPQCDFPVLTDGDSTGYITWADYGSGVKPEIWGCHNATSWTEIATNIWRADNDSGLDIGNILFENGTVYGRRNTSMKNLTVQGDFYYNDSSNLAFVYSTDNPTTYYNGTICLAVNDNIFDINNIEYNRFENLSLRYGANHGIEGQTSDHIWIKSVDCYDMGGTWAGAPTRRGNCFQFWKNSDHAMVEYSFCSDAFDVCYTWQGTTGTNYDADNITFRNNIGQKSEYCFETFNSDSGVNADVDFVQNTCYDIGAGKFSEQRISTRWGECFTSATTFNLDLNFSDNICYKSDNRILRSDSSWDDFNTLLSDYNLLWRDNESGMTNELFLYSSAKYYTFGAYQTASSKDGNSIFDVPLFIDAEGGNFTQYNNSPGCRVGSDGGDIGAFDCLDENAPITDTCTYGGSGDFRVDMADHCVISTDVDIGTNCLELFGTGSFWVSGTLETGCTQGVYSGKFGTRPSGKILRRT